MANKENKQTKKGKKWLITGFVILGIGLAAIGGFLATGIITIAADLIPLTAGLSIGVPAGGAIVDSVAAKKAAKNNAKAQTKSLSKEATLEPIPVVEKENELFVSPVTGTNKNKENSKSR